GRGSHTTYADGEGDGGGPALRDQRRTPDAGRGAANTLGSGRDRLATRTASARGAEPTGRAPGSGPGRAGGSATPAGARRHRAAQSAGRRGQVREPRHTASTTCRAPQLPRLLAVRRASERRPGDGGWEPHHPPRGRTRRRPRGDAHPTR